MDLLLLALVLVPAIGALIARIAPAAGSVGVLVALLGSAPAAVLVVAAAGGDGASVSGEWLPGPGLELGLTLDGLSAVMSATVALVGLVVLTHARGYFAGEQRAPQAIAALLGFIAAMQALVLASNLLTLLIFWEIVGAFSARLIAYNRGNPDAPAAAIRAFLTTRTADLGLYAAVGALFASGAGLGFDAARPEGFLGLLVGGGLVLAAAGKSAQFPFQTWLTGAMAGPTPVSALLHSATMVAAGVYLLIRAQPLLAGWPLELAGWLGAATATLAALFAFRQTDLKVTLASSTSSQLGLMFVAAGAAAPAAALFHLIAHAAGKAGLFLSAGLFQKRRGSTEFKALRGIDSDEPRGFFLFLVVAASIAAVPPLAAFWSKDAILVAAEENVIWFVLAVVASAGTAAYLGRAALLLRGNGAGPEDRRPRGRTWMLLGTGSLALLSVGLGLIQTPLGELVGGEMPSPRPLSVAVSLLALGTGAWIAVARPSLPAWLDLLAERQLHTDASISVLVVRPLLALSRAANRTDRALDRLVDRIGRSAPILAGLVARIDASGDRIAIDGAGAATVRVAGASDRLERGGIDRLVDGLARLIARSGDELPRLQSGQLYVYLRNTIIGMAALILVFAITAIA